MTAVLQLIDVHKTHGSGAASCAALEGIDLAVDAGELVAVMGPSGSGKSTMLTIAGGLDVPTSGQVLVHGRDLAVLSRDERATMRRRAIGYVFQELNLLAALTAVENVAMPLELDGVPGKAARASAERALDAVGMSHKSASFPDELSGGERQRVAIARAIVVGTAERGVEGKPRLLLADEPTGALDSINGEAVMAILRRACDGGAAGVLVTHDAQLAAWADRIVFLRDGRMVGTTRPAAGPETLLGAP